MKKCSRCKTEKPIDAFYLTGRTLMDGSKSTSRLSRCKQCVAEAEKEWSNTHKDRRKAIDRKTKLKVRYGLSLEEYDSLLLSQGGGCAICGGSNRKRNLHVDHCHKTMKVRGLLCYRCNRGIGYWEESPELLQNAIQYIVRSK